MAQTTETSRRTFENAHTSAARVAEATGSVEKALEAAQIPVYWRDLAGLSLMYLPPRFGRPNGKIAMDGEPGDLVKLLALAHHHLGHRTLRVYAYAPGAAVRYSSPWEEVEAAAWARTFRSAIEAMALLAR